MSNFTKFGILVLQGALVVSAAQAGFLDRPEGIKIGQHMTLRPYVSVSASYDSNVRSRHDDKVGDVMWTVSPGLGVSYDADNWSLLLSGYYNYRVYCKKENSDYNGHSYGQDLRWNWSNSVGAEKGWSLVLAESFQQVTMSDDMTYADGRGYTADSRQLQISAAVQRRFNEHWHADINGGYYWLDYLNDVKQQQAMYGWDRWQAGAEIGYAPTKWTDILLAGSYQNFRQKNAESSQYINDRSQGFTVQGGLGSYLTDRISYRLMGGYSYFDYGGAGKTGGFTYTVSGNWKIGETWNTMLLATSYYQPSEQQYASMSRVDAFSWGLSKTMIRGKLRGTLDFRYHRDSHEYVGGDAGYDYVVNVLTGRLGFDYNLNRLLAFFVYGEYQRSFNSEGSERNYAYDYDRWRVTTGIRLKY